MTIGELIRRQRVVVEMDLPEARPGPWEYGLDPQYFYHPREWVAGYQTAARDLLHVIEREGLEP